MLDLNGKSILITGGTGSFGKMFTKLILERNPDVKRWLYLSEMNKNILTWLWIFQKLNILQ